MELQGIFQVSVRVTYIYGIKVLHEHESITYYNFFIQCIEAKINQ